MKKILISTSIILTMLFSFIIDSSLQVSASSPDLSKYDYVYDFSEFGGYTDFVHVTHPDTDKEFFFDRDTTKLYTNMPYCTFVEYELYSVDNGRYNGNACYVFLSYSEFEFERVIGTTSDGSVSWDTITFDDDDFSNNVDSMVSFSFKPGEKYRLQDVFIDDDYTRLNTFFFETSDFSKSLSNFKSLGISNVAKVTEIFYSNFELNDYILPFSADSLTVTYNKIPWAAGKPRLDENGQVAKESFLHQFTFVAKQDCVVDLSIYDSNVIGFASGDPVENYKPYLWWRMSGINATLKSGTIISVDEAIQVRTGAMSADFVGQDGFVNKVDWYYNTYLNDLHKRYYNLTGKMIMSNLPFIDEFDLNWKEKIHLGYAADLESWARQNNILVDYTGKIAIKRYNNFKNDYVKLKAGQTYNELLSYK